MASILWLFGYLRALLIDCEIAEAGLDTCVPRECVTNLEREWSQVTTLPLLLRDAPEQVQNTRLNKRPVSKRG